MNKNDLIKRTKDFSLRIIKLVDALPGTIAGKNIGNQIFRSGTSVAANYRAACRTRSTSEFIAKLGIVEEEADETMFWLEMIMDSETIKKELLQDLYKEANEITAIIVSSKITARNNKNKK
ncbi:TPA: four helix bundle protein [Candidatus Falkowbacteria bacterium]|nr:four helix bundle protein [Candidatus Falkowbacteria bacterium]HAY12680.1 four helix bundle protein [Candidatus Falkowbacteria bacterium]HBI96666.1 four helix bundle protein [Candidatus Falkowbacteria bacterium]HBT27118.1 four helix bundle protein [Candidatus Falkowbacteria bacterium]HBY14371.1 four helix bundle protein [Candidatus Falkowbacteria bacterium]